MVWNLLLQSGFEGPSLISYAAALERVILFTLDKAAMNWLGDGSVTHPVRLDHPQDILSADAPHYLRWYEQYV